MKPTPTDTLLRKFQSIEMDSNFWSLQLVFFLISNISNSIPSITYMKFAGPLKSVGAGLNYIMFFPILGHLFNPSHRQYLDEYM